MTKISLSTIRYHRPRERKKTEYDMTHNKQFDKPIAYGNIQTGESWERIQEVWDREGVEVIG